MHAYTIRCRAQKRQAAHRRRQAKIDPFTYCRIPRTTRHGVVWEEIELSTQDTAKGVGLFAKIDLPKDLCIPYGGVYVNPQEKETLVRHGNEGKRYHRIWHGAEVRCVGEGGTEEWGMMDAHPQLMQARGIPAGAWPGGYCNQADRSEDLNADLLQHDGKCTVPMYQWMDDRCRNLFVKLRRPVRAGEEILVEYGYSARRQSLWGFGPLAKRPKVPLASKSNLRPRNVKTGPYGEMQIFG